MAAPDALLFLKPALMQYTSLSSEHEALIMTEIQQHCIIL